MLFDHNIFQMFGKVWMTDAPDFIAKLKNKSLGYTSLESFSHSMDVNLASSGLTRQSDPTAIYQFNLSASGGKKNSPGECVTAEFSHDELYSFLMQLDQVQSQLDALAST